MLCTNCSAYLPTESYNSQRFSPCPICDSLIRVDVFPAVNKTFSRAESGELLLMDDEASCFYHSNKQAVVSCSHCGRFLCSLCDIDLDDQHLCASCLESGGSKGHIQKLKNKRFSYENLALILALFPIFAILFVVTWIFAFVSPLTASAAIFIVIRYWKKSTGIVSNGRPRMVIALILAILQLVGVLIFIITLVYS